MFFQAASKSAQLLDESGLNEWNGGPPYVTGPPSDTPQEICFTEHLTEVVHGRRVCLQKETNLVWQQLPLSDLKILLDAAVDEWKVGCRFISEYKDEHWKRVMATLWLQWVARQVYELYTEIYYYHKS
jgi:hypothetical protein